jgi:hypothetical protein
MKPVTEEKLRRILERLREIPKLETADIKAIQKIIDEELPK